MQAKNNSSPIHLQISTAILKFLSASSELMLICAKVNYAVVWMDHTVWHHITYMWHHKHQVT